jgi:hypothetical protein
MALGLTPRQLAYALARIEGLNCKESFKKARPDNRLTDAALRTEANKLERNPKVQAFIAEGLAEARREVLLTRDKKRQILGSIALDKKAPRMARIAAVKVDNDMTGDAAPIRVEGEITLNSIFKALVSTTGLPASTERDAIDVTATPQPTLEDELVPALERAG